MFLATRYARTRPPKIYALSMRNYDWVVWDSCAGSIKKVMVDWNLFYWDWSLFFT